MRGAHLASLKVELDRVHLRESRVRVPDRAAVVRDHVRDALGTLGDLLHAAQLELRLVGGDAVHRETAADLGRGHAAMGWASTQF